MPNTRPRGGRNIILKGRVCSNRWTQQQWVEESALVRDRRVSLCTCDLLGLAFLVLHIGILQFGF